MSWTLLHVPARHVALTAPVTSINLLERIIAQLDAAFLMFSYANDREAAGAKAGFMLSRRQWEIERPQPIIRYRRTGRGLGTIRLYLRRHAPHRLRLHYA